jgi:protein-S-isoprenylcysteine O-methyltransferase Ste14
MMRFLARWRVTIGFVCGAVALWLAHPTATTLTAGLAVAAIGEALRIWAAGHLNKAREVTASGPYRWIGHPLYAGSSIVGAGLAIASHSLAVALLVAAYLGATIPSAVRTEEAYLRTAFGADYERYRRGDPSAGAQRFTVTRAMANREYRALVGLAVAALLLAWKATYNGMFWRAGG